MRKSSPMMARSFLEDSGGESSYKFDYVRRVEKKRPKREIIYQESDGKPMAENTKQYQWLVKIKDNLEIMHRDRHDVFIAGDLFWYPVEGDNRTRFAPDVMVVFGRPKGHRGSYLQWKEGNIPPQVVFEILSPGNTKKEMDRKFDFYETFGVKEYYVYNPDNNDFQVWIREHQKLIPLEENKKANWVSPHLNVKFKTDHNELKIFSPNNEQFLYLPDRVELDRKIIQKERQRADQEKLLANQERQRADQEKLRADQNAKRLELYEKELMKAKQLLKAQGVSFE